MILDPTQLKSVAVVHRGLRLDNGEQWIEIQVSNKQLHKLVAAWGRMTEAGATPEDRTQCLHLLENIIIKFNGCVPDWLQEDARRTKIQSPKRPKRSR